MDAINFSFTTRTRHSHFNKILNKINKTRNGRNPKVTKMTMRFFVVDEDVPIYTFSPPLKVNLRGEAEQEVAFAFSAPTKVCNTLTQETGARGPRI